MIPFIDACRFSGTLAFEVEMLPERLPLNPRFPQQSLSTNSAFTNVQQLCSSFLPYFPPVPFLASVTVETYIALPGD